MILSVQTIYLGKTSLKEVRSLVTCSYLFLFEQSMFMYRLSSWKNQACILGIKFNFFKPLFISMYFLPSSCIAPSKNYSLIVIFHFLLEILLSTARAWSGIRCTITRIAATLARVFVYSYSSGIHVVTFQESMVNNLSLVNSKDKPAF